MALFLEQQIKKYLTSIPTPPKSILAAILLAKESKLGEAASLIEQEPGLKAYILKKAESPIFGFIDKPKNVSHALSLFGVPVSVAMLENYLLEILTPKKWSVFKLTNEKYYDFQADLIASWQIILDAICPTRAKKYISAAALLAASVAICEAILADKLDEMKILESQGLKLNDILKRLGGFSLYAIAAKTGKALEFDEKATAIVETAEKPPQNSSEDEILKLAKFLHILFFYKLSQPFTIEAGMDDFATYETEAVESELEKFLELIGTNFEN